MVESMTAMLMGVTLISTGVALIATCVAIAAARSSRASARKLRALRAGRRPGAGMVHETAAGDPRGPRVLAS